MIGVRKGDSNMQTTGSAKIRNVYKLRSLVVITSKNKYQQRNKSV